MLHASTPSPSTPFHTFTGAERRVRGQLRHAHHVGQVHKADRQHRRRRWRWWRWWLPRSAQLPASSQPPQLRQLWRRLPPGLSRWVQGMQGCSGGRGAGGRGSNLALCHEKGRQKQGCCGIGGMNGWGWCNNKAERRYRGIDVGRAEARKCNGAVEEPAESAWVLSLTRAQQHATVLPEGSVPQPAHTSHTSHMFSHFSTLFSRVQQRVRCIRRRLRLPRGVRCLCE